MIFQNKFDLDTGSYAYILNININLSENDVKYSHNFTMYDTVNQYLKSNRTCTVRFKLLFEN